MTAELHPNVTWLDGQPVSARYNDVYFSSASGIEETRHVFLQRNDLAARWRALPPGARFCIGETGFGTGLNFLCAWQLWAECAPADVTLHYVSIEKFPLSVDELTQALALWPQLGPWRDALLQQYRDLPEGWHRFVFDARVTLTLAVGDIADVLPQLDMQADAWFLDGFAPALNPEMWTATVLNGIARRSHPGTTFATYTAAGDVRRGLHAAGFAVDRVPGHGTKRKMLCGVLQRPHATTSTKPWYARPPAHDGSRRAIVIGAGLAGTSAAASLAMRGWNVTLIERHATLAAEASGNPQALLYARLATQATPLRSLMVSGYCHTLRLLQHGLLSPEYWHSCGLLQLAYNEEEAARQRKLLEQDLRAHLYRGVDKQEASLLSGVNVPAGGLYFPDGGWVDPTALCRAFVQHPRVTLRLETEALHLHRAGSEWAVHGANGSVASAPVVVIAGANDTARFDLTRHLPLKPVRGQLSLMPQTPASLRLQSIICGEGYIAPAHDGWHTLGATSKFRDTAIDIRVEEHRANLHMLNTLMPALHESLQAATLDINALPGRAGIRISTPDYLPIVGPLVDADAFKTTYAALRRDALLRLDAPAPWLPGLYVSTGHGSRGLITAPLSGEILASYIDNEPAPLSTQVMEAIHPSRFLLRALIRQETT